MPAPATSGNSPIHRHPIPGNASRRPSPNRSQRGTKTPTVPGTTSVNTDVLKSAQAISRLRSIIQTTQAIGKGYINSPCGGVNVGTNVLGEGKQQFALLRVYNQKRRAGDPFAGGLHVANNPEKSGGAC